MQGQNAPRPTAASDHEQRGGEGGGEADGKGERGDENGHERVGCGGGGLGASAEARGDHSAGPLRWPQRRFLTSTEAAMAQKGKK